MPASSQPNVGREDDPLGAGAIVAQLHRILESATLAAAARSRDLIAFVVTETIAGRGDHLNERVIARLALGRPASVDTRLDAGGRVQAGRARELLQRYYADEGQADPIRIAIPRGQYAATFSRPGPQLGGGRPSGSVGGTTGPMIAVVNLAHGGIRRERRIAFGLAESLVASLSRFPGVRVAGPISLARMRLTDAEIAGIATRTDASYVLHGRVTESDGVLRVTMHLVDAASNEVRWSDSFDRRNDEFTGFGAEDDIVGHVVAVVGDFHGIVLRDTTRPAHRDGDERVAEALRAYYSFLAELGPDSAAEVCRGLEEARQLEPRNPTVLSCLASAHAVAVLMRGAQAASESMVAAEVLSLEALVLDPSNAAAHNVLAVVLLARGRLAEADQRARVTLRLTPFHPGNIYAAGMVIGACGDWDAGIRVIRRAVQLNPYGPSHHRTLLAIDALLRDDVADALAEASLVRFSGHLFGPMLRMICLDEMGLTAEGARERAEVLALVPRFFDDPGTVLRVSPTLPAHVVEHLVDRIERSNGARTGAVAAIG